MSIKMLNSSQNWNEKYDYSYRGSDAYNKAHFPKKTKS